MHQRHRWQAGMDAGRLVLTITGVVLFLRFNGLHHWWMSICFLAGLGAILMWLRYARPSLRRQALMLALMLVYVFVMPVAASGHWAVLIFVAGMLLPVTLAVAALYFGVLKSSRAAR